jgi:hypothetical protein
VTLPGLAVSVEAQPEKVIAWVFRAITAVAARTYNVGYVRV